MISSKRDWFIISLSFILTTAILYGYYFLFHPYKLQWVYQTWDGPSYVMIAKTFYNEELTRKINFISVVGSGYFAAHFILYPAFIRLFAFIGYFRSMLFVSGLFGLGSILAFYEIITRLKLAKHPLWLALPWVLFPPRWFLLTRTGASESTFVFFSLLLWYFFLKKKHWLAALMGALAQLTRFTAVHWWLAIVIIFIVEAIKQKKLGVIKQLLPYSLLPLVLFAHFYLFQIRYGNFWQFFGVQKEFSQAHWPPFWIFTRNQTFGIQTYWLEGHALFYILYLAGILALFNKRTWKLAIFGLSFYLPYIFWVHMDLSRLLVPLVPLLLIGAQKFFSHKATVIAIYLLYPAVFAHFIGFTSWNLAP